MYIMIMNFGAAPYLSLSLYIYIYTYIYSHTLIHYHGRRPDVGQPSLGRRPMNSCQKCTS